jgi:hypothetical protein
MSDATQAEEKREGPTPEQLAQRARFERLSDQVRLPGWIRSSWRPSANRELRQPRCCYREEGRCGQR